MTNTSQILSIFHFNRANTHSEFSNTRMLIASDVLHHYCTAPESVTTWRCTPPIITNLGTNGNGNWSWHITPVCGWHGVGLIWARAWHTGAAMHQSHLSTQAVCFTFATKRRNTTPWKQTHRNTSWLFSNRRPALLVLYNQPTTRMMQLTTPPNHSTLGAAFDLAF